MSRKYWCRPGQVSVAGNRGTAPSVPSAPAEESLNLKRQAWTTVPAECQIAVVLALPTRCRTNDFRSRQRYHLRHCPLDLPSQTEAMPGVGDLDSVNP